MKVVFHEFFREYWTENFEKKLCKICFEKCKFSCIISKLLPALWNFLKMFETCCLGGPSIRKSGPRSCKTTVRWVFGKFHRFSKNFYEFLLFIKAPKPWVFKLILPWVLKFSSFFNLEFWQFCSKNKPDILPPLWQ